MEINCILKAEKVVPTTKGGTTAPEQVLITNIYKGIFGLRFAENLTMNEQEYIHIGKVMGWK